MLSANPNAAPEEQRGLAMDSLRILDSAGNPEVAPKSYHQRRAQFFRSLGDTASAQAEQTRADALVPSTAVDKFLLGMESIRVGNLEEARGYLKQVLEQQPNHFWANYYLAGCFLRMRPQRFERALAPLTNCVQLKQEFVWSYLLRGFVNGELEDFDAAFADFAAAENLTLDEVAQYGLLVYRGVVHLRQGMDQDKRGQGLRERGQTNEADRETQLAQKCYQTALLELERAALLRPKQAQAFENLAEVYLRLNQPDNAVQRLNKAIAVAPSARLYRNRSRLQAKSKDFALALRDLDEAIKIAPSDQDQIEAADDQLLRGQVLFGLARYVEALAAFDNSLAAAPHGLLVHQLRGETLYELARYAEAVAAMDKYQARARPSAAASRARGLAHAKLHDNAGAIEDFTRALEIDRAEGRAVDPPTLTYRAWAHLVQGTPKLASVDFDEALALPGSQKADCYAGRACARVALGQWRPAVKDAEAAIDEETPTARTHFNVARVYAQAAVKASKDPKLQDRPRQELAAQYRRRALSMLRHALEKTPADNRSAFWDQYVKPDPALLSIRGTPEYARIALDFVPKQK